MRFIAPLLLLALPGCASVAAAPTTPWPARATKRVQEKLKLPPGSVTIDTGTAAFTFQVPGDSAAVVWINAATGVADTVHDPLRLDRRPDVWAFFELPALKRFGYFEGEFTTFDPLAKLIWQMVPRGQPTRLLSIRFDCGSEGCDGRDYFADSLDILYPRR